MTRKKPEPDVTEDPRYHDTWRLLKKYRDVVWSLELSVQQIQSKFKIEYGNSIEDFLDMAYLAGADLGGSELEHHAQCIERSNKILTLVRDAVDLLRTRHKDGEAYYWLLYYSFFPHRGFGMWTKLLNSSAPISGTSATSDGGRPWRC